MAKKFVLNEQTMMTLGFVILVVMLLSAMSCGKKEAFFNTRSWRRREKRSKDKYHLINDKRQDYIGVTGNWWRENDSGYCRRRCDRTGGCKGFTFFKKGGFSQDPNLNCKIMLREHVPAHLLGQNPDNLPWVRSPDPVSERERVHGYSKYT